MAARPSTASNGDAGGGGGGRGQAEKTFISAEDVVNHRLSSTTEDVAGSIGTATPPDERQEGRDPANGRGTTADVGEAWRDAPSGEDVDAEELSKRRKPKPARASSTSSLHHSRSYIAPEDKHLPKASKTWQASVKLALEGASVQYYEAAAQLFEGAENEDQEEVILKRASKSPRFTEALVRQGLEVEELGPRSHLPVDRRAALLAAVLQERDFLPDQEEATTAERMSRVLRGRLQEVLDKTQRREAKRREVLNNAYTIEEERMNNQIAYLWGKTQRCNMALDRRDQERAKEKGRLAGYFQYVQDVADWAREDERRQMLEQERLQEQKANRRRAHQRAQQKQEEQRQRQRRQAKAAKEHQAVRFARMRDMQTRDTNFRQSYDQSVYQEQCRPMLDALRQMNDPRGIASYIKWLEAQEQAHSTSRRAPSSNWARVDNDDLVGEQTVWRGHVESHDESQGSPLAAQPGEDAYAQQQPMSPLRSKLLQSLRQPSSQRDAATTRAPSQPQAAAGGGGAAGVRMLRQAREAERTADHLQMQEELLLEQVKSDLKFIGNSPLNDSAASTAYEASSSPTAFSPDTTWATSPHKMTA